MWYGVLADLVVVVHFLFVIFVLIGGLWALRWPPAMWLHLPAVAWGVAVEFMGWICPLTPLELWLRGQEGRDVQDADFVTRYLLPILYPVDLTREMQLMLGSVVLIVNIAIYAWLWRRGRLTPRHDRIQKRWIVPPPG